jgi:hypothetical protein
LVENLQKLEAWLANVASHGMLIESVLQVLRRALMSTEIIGQSALYQEWVARAQREGRSVEDLDLVQEFMRDLRVYYALQDAAFITLRASLGELPDDLLKGLIAASPETCQEVVAHVLTDTLDDVRVRLGCS